VRRRLGYRARRRHDEGRGAGSDDFGGYQPGDTWERGLVPRELQKPLQLAEPELPLPVSPPLDQLGRPFASRQLPKGKEPDYYVQRFLQRFGADIGRGVVYRDRSGHAVVISDQLFRNAAGAWKVLKFGREVDIERLAEAIFDPDEIWVDWVVMPDGSRRLVRRYLRWHSETGSYSSFVWTSHIWQGLTSFAPRKRGGKGKPDQSYLEKHRRGALAYRRE
ncbi:PBECR2 nuclease fold domain-containing protein, partial [Ruegeria sp. HKCCD8929]|uniref:PBECR2 nuclease fold domain-containing protein n=1 Tax=Ruegeria sp. HKCCD8929 TaxID=2683006 RepID=UPI0020C44698